MNTKNEITVIIADDHELLREGFKSMVRRKGIKVLATAKDGEELLQLVNQHLPEVVITDIKMPRMDGIQATAIIKRNIPATKVLALTNYNETGLIKDMIGAGAEGYILKDGDREELLNAIKTVREGKRFFCSHTSAKMLEIDTPPKPQVHFTRREIEVMVLISKGYSSRQIGKELGINNRTVETHRANIYQKTGAKTTVGVAIFASRYGYV